MNIVHTTAHMFPIRRIVPLVRDTAVLQGVENPIVPAVVQAQQGDRAVLIAAVILEAKEKIPVHPVQPNTVPRIPMMMDMRQCTTMMTMMWIVILRMTIMPAVWMMPWRI